MAAVSLRRGIQQAERTLTLSRLIQRFELQCMQALNVELGI